MSGIKIAEIFHSLQGEGKFVGVPSVFVRTFGCNFKCQGFGMPQLNHDHYEVEPSREAGDIAKIFKSNPSKWTSYHELPLVTTGCDSYASWHPAFKDLSPKMSIDSIVTEAEHERRIHNPVANQDGSTHLVITGGEPLLGWQKQYPEMIDAFVEKGYREITFETNGTQKINDDFADYMLTQQLSATKTSPRYTFSVSPKLPCSGEDPDKALQPEIVKDYMRFGDVYLKFVVASRDDAKWANKFINEYHLAGWKGDIYFMPVGGVHSQYDLNAPQVAELAMYYGYKYSPRLQVDLWQNEWGT